MKRIVTNAFLLLGIILSACGSVSGGGSKSAAPEEAAKPSPKQDKTDKKLEVDIELKEEKRNEDAGVGIARKYSPVGIFEPPQSMFGKKYNISYFLDNMPEFGVNRCVAVFWEDKGEYGAMAGSRVVHDWMINTEEKNFFCVEATSRTLWSQVLRRRYFIPMKTSSGRVCMGSVEFDEKDKKIHDYEEVDQKYCLLP